MTMSLINGLELREPRGDYEQIDNSTPDGSGMRSDRQYLLDAICDVFYTALSDRRLGYLTKFPIPKALVLKAVDNLYKAYANEARHQLLASNLTIEELEQALETKRGKPDRQS
jgi:hypothetical protein